MTFSAFFFKKMHIFEKSGCFVNKKVVGVRLYG